MAKAEAIIDIEAIGGRGDGIATVDGTRVFVPFTAPGDRVRVRLDPPGPHGVAGRMVALERASPQRREPPCAHFGQCGGCALQHVTDEAYAAWKMAQLEAALDRLPAAPGTVEPLFRSPPGSRRRADWTLVNRAGGAIIGFNERGSHRVIDQKMCPVLHPALEGLIGPLGDLMGQVLGKSARAEVRGSVTDSGVDLVIVTPGEIGRRGREALAAFAETHDLARVAKGHPKQRGLEPVAARRPVRALFGGVAVDLPPFAFMQATAEGEAALGAVVAEAAKGATRIVDLYAGVGTFSLPLAAKGAKVAAFEGDRDAVEALALAGRKRTLSNLRVERRDLERKPVEAGELEGSDVVIFDPPRAGARHQAPEIAESGVPVVIAISCNPATFQRDAAVLMNLGYRLERVRPVDQFLWSPHLELAAVFRRG